jgi:hypothetical protein
VNREKTAQAPASQGRESRRGWTEQEKKKEKKKVAHGALTKKKKKKKCDLPKKN